MAVSKSPARQPWSMRRRTMHALGLLVCVMVVMGDALAHHFGAPNAWHSPVWWVSVSVESLFIGSIAIGKWRGQI